MSLNMQPAAYGQQFSERRQPPRRETAARAVYRRDFCRGLLGATLMAASSSHAWSAEESRRWSYVLATCMYGTLPLSEILPQVRKTAARYVDIWPRVHGNQREQIEAMGHEAFRRMLEKHDVRVGIFTRYDLGPFRIDDELAVASEYGARLIVVGSSGPRGLQGEPLREAVRDFVRRLEPQCRLAEKHGVTIGIENHGNALIESPDSIRWLADFSRGRPLAVALAPYHLPQDASALASLIRELGDRLGHFYAWQHGMGCHKKLPKQQELLQMPGRGPLDFTPLLAALKRIGYAGFVEIFMHPVPRGIPILETAAEVTAEINRARTYLDGLKV